MFRDEEDGLEMGSLNGKWQDTATDRRDMFTLGRLQELCVSPCMPHIFKGQLTENVQRNFSFIPLVGFACNLISTWEFIIT